MPRLPVDGKRVVEHRITLGTKERQMVDRIVGSYQFNRVATPTVALMSNVTGMAVFAGIVAVFVPKIYDYLNLPGMDPVEAVTQGIKDTIVEQEKAAIEGEQSFADKQNQFVIDAIRNAWSGLGERVF
jgi:hypothetical protein